MIRAPLASGVRRQRLGALKAPLVRAAARGKLGNADEAKTRLRLAETLQGAAETELVIEAVPEDLESKRQVMERLGEICPPGRIFITNTSTLSITEIAAASGRLARVLLYVGVGMAAAALVAGTALTYAFVTSDFSLRLVTLNSHTDKPMLYKVTGVWANHEGSMLLWVFMLALFVTPLIALGARSVIQLDPAQGSRPAFTGTFYQALWEESGRSSMFVATPGEALGTSLSYAGATVVISLLLGTQALSLIDEIGAAFKLGIRSGGVLLALLVLLLYIPVLIFGAGAVEAKPKVEKVQKKAAVRAKKSTAQKAWIWKKPNR